MDQPDTRRPLIYIVEDEVAVARLIASVLKDFGFDSETFRTAADVLRRIKTAEPDLCITDLGLPDMDGMELVKRLRESRHFGVLILTGRGYAGDRVMGLELGADDYVVKPFEPRELVARVRSILRRTATRPATEEARRQVAEFSGWRFHAGTNTLTAPDGQDHALSTAEARLLAGFLERPNRILTREQLMDSRDVSPMDRSIDVRISRLRRKLETDPANPKLIKTVYGAGYLFSTAVEWK